jgi:uncharacterized damage-inducible protein DinB
MSPAVASEGKVPALEFREALREAFATNEEAKQLLLSNMPDAAWRAAPPCGKGRTIADIAAHIHHVRLMWLSACEKSAKPPTLPPDKAIRQEVPAALNESSVQRALVDAAGRVPNFKPNVVAFVGYFIAGDSHHRGQITMLARQGGHPVDPKVAYGLWERGSLWRDCGFGRPSGGTSSR